MCAGNSIHFRLTSGCSCWGVGVLDTENVSDDFRKERPHARSLSVKDRYNFVFSLRIELQYIQCLTLLSSVLLWINESFTTNYAFTECLLTCYVAALYNGHHKCLAYIEKLFESYQWQHGCSVKQFKLHSAWKYVFAAIESLQMMRVTCQSKYMLYIMWPRITAVLQDVGGQFNNIAIHLQE